jgi:hypothetical protein
MSMEPPKGLHWPRRSAIAGTCVRISATPSKLFLCAPVPDSQNRSLLTHPNQRRSHLRRPARQLHRARNCCQPGRAAKGRSINRSTSCTRDLMSLRGIARHLGLARNTVRKYFQYLPLPRQRQPRASQLDPYEDYLLAAFAKAAATPLCSIENCVRGAFGEPIAVCEPTSPS